MAVKLRLKRMGAKNDQCIVLLPLIQKVQGMVSLLN